MLTVLFRCDASSVIGFGHLMRSIALAEALQESGDDVRFLIREEPSAARVLQDAGLSASWLPASCSLDEVSRALRQAVDDARSGGCVPWVVIDSSQEPRRQSTAALGAGARVLVVDDLGWSHGRVQALVNPNLDAEPSWYPQANGTRLLLGAAYILLRREVLDLPPRADVGAAVRRLLVTLGGSDVHNRTALVVQGLAALEERHRYQLDVDVVLGHGNIHEPEIRRLIAVRGLRCTVHCGVLRMSSILSRADLAITAAGGTVYETARCGIPTLMMVLSENQQRNAAAFERNGLSVLLGRADRLSPSAVADAVGRLMADPQRRTAMNARCRAVVDGRGAERIRQALLAMEMEPAAASCGGVGR